MDEDEKNAQIQAYLAQSFTPQEEQQPLSQPDIAALPPLDEAAKLDKFKSFLSPQYLQKDNAAIDSAKEQASNVDFIANIGQALGNIATANSRAHGGQGIDSSLYQGIRQQGQQGLNQAIADKQNHAQEYLRNHELERETAQDVMRRGEYDQKQKAGEILTAKSSGDSDVSKRAVSAARATFPEYASVIQDGMSANEVAEALKAIEKKSNLDTNTTLKTIAVKRQSDADEEKKKGVDKSTALKDFQKLGSDLDADLASSRTSIGQANNKIQGATRVMTFADVTPEELNKAKSNPKLMAELKNKLDKLTSQQYLEVVTGLMSQIAPGTGSLGQLEHLRADTASQRIANVQQYLTSEGVPANMGDILLNNLLTLKNEQDTSKNVLNNHISKMQAKHPHAFMHEDTADLAKNLLSKYTAAGDETENSQASNIVPAPSHSRAADMLDWAKNHPNDPLAAEVIKRMGEQNASR